MGINVFGYHAGNNGVSHYRVWQPLKYLDRIEGFHVERLPDRLERIQWAGLTGPCNIPGIGSHSDIVDRSDVIISNFRGSFEDGVRLEIQSQLKPVVIDCDDDILNIDVNNPAEHLKAWREEKDDIWLEIPEGMEDSEEWKINADSAGGKILQHPKDGKWYLWQCRRAPWKNAVEQMKMAALLTVSTPKLKRLYQKFNANTVVIPNAVDFEWWPEKKIIDDGIIRLGLFGSNTHYSDWFEIVDTLDLILRENP